MNTQFYSPLELRRELEKRGVRLERRGDKLVCFPKGAAGELLPDVARMKPQLLEMLVAEEAALAELARVRETRRFDFQNGQRVFRHKGRFVALNVELIRLWREAEEACGHSLTVWGRPPIQISPLPPEVPKHLLGAAWIRAEKRFPGWAQMDTNEKRQLAACVALLDHDIDPDEIFPSTSKLCH